MNTELNKQISVWRGSSTPPTDYHLWVKENGDIYIKIDSEWTTISKILNIQDLTNLQKDVKDLLTLEIAETDATEETNYKSYELLVAGQRKGVRIDIPRDKFINDVKLGYTNAAVDANTGVIDIGTGEGDPLFLIYSMLKANGSYAIIKIDLTKFITEKEYSDGLEVNNNKLKVKIDPASEFLSVSDKGIKVSGIKDNIKSLSNSISDINSDLIKAFTKVTFSASPTLIEEDKDTPITLSYKLLYNGKRVTPDTLILKRSDAEEPLTTDTTTTSFLDTISALATYSLKITYKGQNIPVDDIRVSSTVAQYYGAGSETFDNSIISTSTKQVLKTSPVSNCSITFTQGQYLWLCIPVSMKITRVTSSGFDVPMNTLTSKVVNNYYYSCYRSTNSFNAGTVNFIIYGS